MIDADRPHASPPDACTALAELAAREAVAAPMPRRFVRRLGHAGAGIRPGPLVGLLDLALAGSDPLPGHGFRRELDDGTGGQVRHFCGVVAACDRFGARATWWISVHLRRDAPDSPDGRLSDLAIEFVGLLRRGELDVDDAPGWLRRTLCASAVDKGPEKADADTPPA